MTELRAKRLAKIRDGGLCRLCQRGGVWDLHVHHIYPKALYPDRATDLDNMVTLCLTCHLGITHGGDIDDGANPSGRWRKFTLWHRWIIRQKP